MTQGNSAQRGADEVPPVDGGASAARPEEAEPEEKLVVRDRRRVDPHGTRPRPDGEKASPDAGADEPEAAEVVEGDVLGDGDVALKAELEERTSDLKRVVAEYANYRRRVDRDRALAGEQATGAVLKSLLPVLDDLDRAREHGDLVGPFAAVAEQLVAVLSKAGLTPYGEPGDPFDPVHHEAVAHSVSADVTEPTCVMVMRRGYRHGEKMLRPALVAVADPGEPEEAPADEPSEADRPAAADAGEAGRAGQAGEAGRADNAGDGDAPERDG